MWCCRHSPGQGPATLVLRGGRDPGMGWDPYALAPVCHCPLPLPMIIPRLEGSTQLAQQWYRRGGSRYATLCRNKTSKAR